jgi:polyhydroxyalkanoate synthesis regulator phasin
MAKQNTKEQIISIEEQIKKLKEKQKKILNNSQREIGKYLMNTWDVEDVNAAKALIDSLKDQVRSLDKDSSSNEDTKEKNNVDLNQPIG